MLRPRAPGHRRVHPDALAPAERIAVVAPGAVGVEQVHFLGGIVEVDVAADHQVVAAVLDAPHAALAVDEEADLVAQAGGEQLAGRGQVATRGYGRQRVASDHRPHGRRCVPVRGRVDVACAADADVKPVLRVDDHRTRRVATGLDARDHGLHRAGRGVIAGGVGPAVDRRARRRVDVRWRDREAVVAARARGEHGALAGIRYAVAVRVQQHDDLAVVDDEEVAVGGDRQLAGAGETVSVTDHRSSGDPRSTRRPARSRGRCCRCRAAPPACPNRRPACRRRRAEGKVISAA